MAALQRTKPPLILAVDDDSVIRIHVKSSLKNIGQVEIVGSGKDALCFLDKNKVDIIVLDVDMPEMSGLEVYEKMKQNPATKDIPVIFLTGVENDETLKAVKADGKDYILKPVSTPELLEHVQQLLKINSHTTK